MFVDGRLDLYGDDFVLDEYFEAVFGRSAWKDVLDRCGVTSAILPRGVTLASLLRESPEWKEVYSDELNALFRRREGWGCSWCAVFTVRPLGRGAGGSARGDGPFARFLSRYPRL